MLILGILPVVGACSSPDSDAAETIVPTGTVTEQLSSSSPQPTEPLPTPTLPTPDLDPQRIQLSTNTKTNYYSVTGTTTVAIFDSIDRNGPRDAYGEKGSGLTSATWGYRWQPQQISGGCVIGSMTISLEMEVTLPRHAQPGSLSQHLGEQWAAFARGVEIHEQAHVDINAEGAQQIRQAMIRMPAFRTCDELESEVEAVWQREQRAIDSLQDQFHAREEARLAQLREPLQKQIDLNRSQIGTLAAQIASLDKNLEQLNTQIMERDLQLKAIKSQIDVILMGYPESELPPDVYAQYDELRRLYNSLAPEYNNLVGIYNQAIKQRNDLADQHDELVLATNVLVEQYNWMR